ncbi:MAG: DUF4214 domain-containing protein [Hoeflea sp.]|nr:DUF4214 domain-containing protein [Hoeflea sp.]
MAAAIRNIATGNSFVDSVLNVSKWSSPSITFGFTTSSTAYGTKYGLGEQTKGYQPLSGSQAAAAEKAMSKWAELIDLKITKASGADADIRIASSSSPTTAWAYGPGSSAEAGDVWFGTAKGYFTSPQEGNYAYMTFLHELGHAIGLSHPHENKLGASSGGFIADDGTEAGLCPCCAGSIHGAAKIADAGQPDTQAASANTYGYYGGDTSSNSFDAMAYSIMSYSSYAFDGRKGYTNGTWDYAQSPMLRDIAAVQHMYGANYTTRSGDTVYSWNPAEGKVFETIWDGGGRDTLDLSAYDSNLNINLAPGSWSSFGTSQLADLGPGQKAPGNIALSYLYQGDERSLIENAIGGAGDDVLKGNTANNVLIGGEGNDRLEGITGNNVLVGGFLNNELSLAGLNTKEWISASLRGFTGNDDGDDILVGGSGNDVCLPGTGTNTVSGGDGMDTLVINTNVALISISQKGGSLVFSYEDSSVSSTGIEYLATKDGVFKFGGMIAAETKLDISLLYSAGLGRDLDKSGMQYWAGELENGKTLSSMADGIILSQEFNAKFGNSHAMSASDYVDVLYKNVLGRAADEKGASYWVGELDHGMSRSDALVAFATGSENRAKANHMDTDFGDVSLVAVNEAQWAEIWA